MSLANIASLLFQQRNKKLLKDIADTVETKVSPEAWAWAFGEAIVRKYPDKAFDLSDIVARSVSTAMRRRTKENLDE